MDTRVELRLTRILLDDLSCLYLLRIEETHTPSLLHKYSSMTCMSPFITDEFFWNFYSLQLHVTKYHIDLGTTVTTNL